VVNVAGVTPEQQAMLNALIMTPHQRRQRIEQLRAETAKAVPAPSAAAEDADE
jgi:hypothetical protein